MVSRNQASAPLASETKAVTLNAAASTAKTMASPRPVRRKAPPRRRRQPRCGKSGGKPYTLPSARKAACSTLFPAGFTVQGSGAEMRRNISNVLSLNGASWRMINDVAGAAAAPGGTHNVCRDRREIGVT
ncbi:hypothetical protein KCP70_13300 [Salmonella enterica subsp. enterica]|nr:hypothetical protein KCP70_13300 [Salmonella enterica subsp. enterica]